MSTVKQARRMDEAPLSKIREILTYANELAASGRDIIHLELGEPDFDTPKHINDAAKRALDEGKVHYPPITGIPELRSAISSKLKRENNLSYDDNEIIVTNGVAQGIFLAVMAFVNEGEEVLVPDPGYLVYFTAPKIAGATVATYQLDANRNFQIDEENLEAKINSNTKMIVLISPNNPVGSILNKASILTIAKAAIKHDLIVVADEIYEKLIYDDIEQTSIASLPQMKERTVLLNGFSKYYAMTGWRLGYIAADKSLIDPLMRLCFYNIASANSFAQWGAIEALEGDQRPSERMKAEYMKRRDVLVGGLNGIHGLSCTSPEGAFYVFLDIKNLEVKANEFCKYLLDEEGVATVPGTVFGENGEGYIRISYANSIEEIEKGISGIKRAIEKLRMTSGE